MTWLRVVLTGHRRKAANAYGVQADDEAVTLEGGTPQGSPASPLIWVIVIDYALSVLRDNADAASSSSSSIPNTDSCTYSYYNNDGMCDDGVEGYAVCPCGTDYSDCGFRYEHDCPLDGATPTGQVDEAANGNDGATGQVDDTNSDDGAMVVIVAIVASVLVAIVAVAIVGCIVSLKCFAIFVLLLSITTLVTTIVSVFTLFGIPAAAISTVAFVLACTWVQHHRLRLLQGQRRQPRRPHFMWRAVLAFVYLPPRCARRPPHYLLTRGPLHTRD